MKNLVVGAVLSSLLAASAHAQTTTPTTPTQPAPGAPGATSTTPAARTAPDAGAPLPGANSFTENQARARFEEQGYTNIAGLAKDADGVWRGSAMKDGRSHSIALDFRGNIVVGQK